MAAEPEKDDTPPIRKLTPEEEKKGARTLGFVMLAFLALMAALLVMAATR